MKCLNCGEQMTSRKENHQYKESGLDYVTLANVEVRSCPNCGTREVAIPRMDDLHRVIAQTVITREAVLRATEIKFLRKYLGWSASDLATYMAVAPETVSRWESGKQDMGPVADRLLRLLVSNREPVTRYPIDLFKHRMRRMARATLKFCADPTWRPEAA
jgi:putative zinc finger/helix-turn-helix YgiT family protein